MMTLALLPVGLIAIYQTRAVTEKARRNAELALLALVDQSALNERLAIQRAFGAADAIAAGAVDLLRDEETCSAHMRAIVSQSARFSFAGIVPLSGQMICSSTNTDYDFSESPTFAETMRTTDNLVRVNASAPISRTSIINVSVPILEDDEMVGRVSLSIPHSALRSSQEGAPPDALKEIVTFNDEGQVLTAIGQTEFLEERLPVGLTLAGLADQKSRAFSALNRLGEDRIYTVVPIEPDQLYVIGIWDARLGVEAQIGDRFPPILFPALMWLTSLAVVLFAIHRLVLRHIRGLRKQMVRFARNRTMAEEDGDLYDMPAELFEMQASFSAMAYSIMQDEANLENAVREKNVLIREIHHRVKNNLQLISSILNMQIRNAPDTETRGILRRIQERVLSLATIHRDLYQANTAGQVNVGNLIEEIVEKSVEIGAASASSVDVTVEIDEIMLYPDQAVPMSLLAAEATTTAMKYVGAPEDETAWLKVTFRKGEGRERIFRVSNSASGTSTSEGSGMGSRLINAFAIQLGARIDIQSTESDYTMTVVFDAADFMPEAGTY